MAEESATSGYVLLRQKSSGKYLAASGANSYSVVFESAAGTADRFLWKVDEGVYTYLTKCYTDFVYKYYLTMYYSSL